MSLATAESALKEVYLSVIRNQLNIMADVVMGKIRASTSDIWGKNIIRLVKWGDDYVQLKADLENLYASFEISDKAVRAASMFAGAFVNVLNFEIENMMLESTQNLRKCFYNEMPKTVTKDKKEIPNPKYMKIIGLKEIFSDSKMLYGLNRKDYKELNPIKATCKFNPIEIQRIIDESDSEADMIICGHKIKRQYMEYLLSHNQQIETVNLSGQNCVVFNNSLPMFCSKDIPENEIYIINTADFMFHQLCDWAWLENETGKILRMVEGRPVYSATLVKYCNLICDNPYKQIKITIKE